MEIEEFTDAGHLEETLRIPEDRVGVLIGKKGRTRKRLEKIADVKIKVSSDGEVRVIGTEATDPLTFMKLIKVIKAIGRGFDPDTALKLLQDDYYLEIINLKDFLGRNAIVRQRARLIGTGGSARKRLEELTDTYIRIYGHTVAIIGDYEGISLAREAILRLAVDGSPHTVVFKHLEIVRRRRKTEKLLRELGILVEE